MSHLEDMPTLQGIPLVTFERYECYEGKNMSDALGSIVKRKMRSGALQNNLFDSDDLLCDINDECDVEDLVFGSHFEAFEWIKMVMSK